MSNKVMYRTTTESLASIRKLVITRTTKKSVWYTHVGLLGPIREARRGPKHQWHETVEGAIQCLLNEANARLCILTTQIESIHSAKRQLRATRKQYEKEG